MKNIKKATFCAPLLLALIVTACDECSLEGSIDQIAAKDSIDCGYAPLRRDRSAIDECVISAFGRGVPFSARYQRMGIDSTVVSGIVYSIDGTLTFLHFDSDPSGSNGDAPVVDEFSCNNPRLTPDPENRPEGTDPFDCDKVSSKGRVCG